MVRPEFIHLIIQYLYRSKVSQGTVALKYSPKVTDWAGLGSCYNTSKFLVTTPCRVVILYKGLSHSTRSFVSKFSPFLLQVITSTLIDII